MPKDKHKEKKWTMREVSALKHMRMEEGLAQKEIAKRLGRSIGSVVAQCDRSGFIRRPYYTKELKDKIRELVKKGSPDTVICLKLNLNAKSLIYLRRLQGLKANRKQYYDRNKANRPWPQCFGCDKKSPIMVEMGWTELTGWSSRVENASGVNITVTLCPECQNRSKEK